MSPTLPLRSEQCPGASKDQRGPATRQSRSCPPRGRGSPGTQDAGTLSVSGLPQDTHVYAHMCTHTRAPTHLPQGSATPRAPV